MAWTFRDMALPMAGGAALAGVGGRLIKNLADILRERYTDPLGSKGALTSNVVQMPVEVTSEQADELRDKGVKVKEMQEKGASVASNIFSMGGGLSSGIPLGALSALALGAGWYGTDKVIDSQRRSEAKQDVEKLKLRIQHVLEGAPLHPDAPVAASMKVAEELHFAPKQEKKAFGLFNIADSVVPWGVGFGAGAVGVMQAARAFQQAREQNKFKDKMQSLKMVLTQQKERPPQLALQPVEMVEGKSPAEQAAENPV